MLGKNHVAVRMTMPTLADIPKDTSKTSRNSRVTT